MRRGLWNGETAVAGALEVAAAAAEEAEAATAATESRPFYHLTRPRQASPDGAADPVECRRCPDLHRPTGAARLPFAHEPPLDVVLFPFDGRAELFLVRAFAMWALSSWPFILLSHHHN